VPTARPEDVARDILDDLRGRKFELAEAVYVLDAAGRLIGVAPMATLLGAEGGSPLGAFAKPAGSVRHDADREMVAAIARRAGVSSVPVASTDGRFLGVVPATGIIEVLSREHEEDINRLAGILHSENDARSALEASWLSRACARLPWLLVGLAGSLLAAAVVSKFESAIREQVALAFFVPAIVYLADAIGTQTEAVAVRGLSLVHRPFWRMLAAELGAGVAMGSTLGALAAPAAYLLGGPALALVVAISVVVAGSLAATIGLALPWLLSRIGRDPAYGSGPLATVIQDVLSLIVYFGTASLLL
jgi:magnesium transporter